MASSSPASSGDALRRDKISIDYSIFILPSDSFLRHRKESLVSETMTAIKITKKPMPSRRVIVSSPTISDVRTPKTDSRLSRMAATGAGVLR